MRAGKCNAMPDRIFHFTTPLGNLTAAASGDALVGLWFDGQKHFGSVLRETEEGGADPASDRTEEWLRLYFQGRDPGFRPELFLRGTDFQCRVWERLLTIPYGHTVSYGQIAAMLSSETGHPVSARAVGNAVGRNPVSLIIPCHRVVGKDGKLTGYAGGLERKQCLLEMERTGRLPVLSPGFPFGTI